MEPALVLAALSIRNLRNVKDLAFSPSRRVTTLSGDNGQGKTSVLEAIYFAATSRSFRTAKPNEMLLHGASSGFVKATFFEEGGVSRDQVASLTPSGRNVTLSGKRPPSLAEYAVRSPIVSFHSRDLDLSAGPSAARRVLLDRVALFGDPGTSIDHSRYKAASAARQRILSLRGASSPDLDAFEEIVATHGSSLTRARAFAASSISEGLALFFPRVADPTLDLAVRFCPGGSPDLSTFLSELRARRPRDLFRGAATFGPHRDDLDLRLGGHPARLVASQGQHRALTIALKLAELRCVAAARGVFPILLLDDVSSELDRDRTAALLSVLGENAGQVFITTTRPELISDADLGGRDRLELRLRDGAIVP